MLEQSLHQTMRIACRSVLGGLIGWAPSLALAEDDSQHFEKHVRPILVDRCEACHSGAKGKTSGGLALDTRDGWVKGGDSGPPIVPGKPDESLLIQAVRYHDDGPQMPPDEGGGKLSESQIAALAEWVARGAIDPRAAAARIGGMTPDEARQWWAFQPLRKAEPPAVRDPAWPRCDIDNFILAELEKQQLAPAGMADRRTLLRRATFDLTGLPPTPAEVEAFASDADPDAFERVVNRLLDSPAYGERWARHWLDVVRYADFYDANPATRTASCELTEAWRYRDWVVEALNSDIPYDRFVVHQIAGDLLPSPTCEEVYPAGLIATTFLSNGVWDRGDADKEKIISDMVDDNIDVIGKTFMGLTLGCARCHDHKFDPITTEDYYALAGIFYSSHILKELGAKGGEYTMNRVPLVPAAVVARRAEFEQQLADLNACIKKLDEAKPPENNVAGAAGAGDADRAALVAQRDQLEREMPPPIPLAMAVQEGGMPGGLFPSIQDVPIHIRGSYAKLGPVVPRRLPKMLAGDDQPPMTSGSGRKQLADWIVAADNPLTPRVIVNRVWQWHFGAGLVRTPSNFGKLGQRPTRPELLDYLAAKFVAEGWSLKRLHRRIMLSATYQQASLATGDASVRDPENRWLARFSARRLEAEPIRDAMLSVSGQLDQTRGGPAGDDLTIRRRSLYVQTARWDRSGYAMLFDAANPDASTEQRTVSTVAPQALLLLNHPFVLEQARQLAARLLKEVSSDDGARLKYAYRLLFGRLPSEDEVAVARGILQSGGANDPVAAWADLAHVLLCSNEFVYLD
ncbi:MAG: PSD1 and planctomycete cytochrome C domain-containing protein [Pirellulales bacterium]|nr:PSD1 and planctomycete cytochrome C domain-containing protein [Pirellulales bacterium]